MQIENFRTFPVVQKATREGKLHVHAWFFDIAAGTVFQYNPEKEKFEAITEEGGSLPGGILPADIFIKIR